MGIVRRSKEEWQRLILEFESSGETQHMFCNRHGLSMSSFKYYRYLAHDRRILEDIADTETRMIPVSLKSSETSGFLLEFRFPEKGSLRFAVGTPPQYVANLIQSLS